MAAAVLPASDVRSILLVYDLWSGELLSSVEVFTSLLVGLGHENEPLYHAFIRFFMFFHVLFIVFDGCHKHLDGFHRVFHWFSCVFDCF